MTGEEIRLLMVWFYNATFSVWCKGIFGDDVDEISDTSPRYDYLGAKYMACCKDPMKFISTLDVGRLNRLAETLKTYKG